jgi:hypothetical protein
LLIGLYLPTISNAQHYRLIGKRGTIYFADTIYTIYRWSAGGENVFITNYIEYWSVEEYLTRTGQNLRESGSQPEYTQAPAQTKSKAILDSTKTQVIEKHSSYPK